MFCTLAACAPSGQAQAPKAKAPVVLIKFLLEVIAIAVNERVQPCEKLGTNILKLTNIRFFLIPGEKKCAPV
jgi:hypothetical protein